MDYQQMLSGLAEMETEARRRTIIEHWETVFTDGFVGFVQGQIESGRQMVSGEGPLAEMLGGALGDALKTGSAIWLAQVLAVWGDMKDLYAQAARSSRVQGESGGMADLAAGRQAMPRGASVSPAANCFRCGGPVAANGLCAGCLAEEDRAEQDFLEYDRQLHDQELDRLDHQRLQDDRTYYDTQQDFSYTPSYDDGY